MVNINRPESDSTHDLPTAPRLRISDSLLSVDEDSPEITENDTPVVFSASGIDVYYSAFRALRDGASHRGE